MTSFFSMDFVAGNMPLVLIAALVLFFVLGFFAGRMIQSLLTGKIVEEERRKAVKKSRAVIGGQFAEQLAPYLPDFPCNPGDAKFLGKPVDFVAFCGSAESSDISEVLFIEVKTATSKLSGREQQIRKAIEEGRVRYVVYKPF